MRDEEVRLREPNRKQFILPALDYETLIGAEHPVRAIWQVLEGLDLSRFCAPIKARENGPGRDATSPRMLLGLWLYGLSEGVNSAREIERLSSEHAAYRWLCGGVSVNHHLLSDFRSGHGAALDELFGQVLGLLLDQRLISLSRVAQDGTPVRASAGAASFRRKACVRAARHHLELLNAARGVEVFCPPRENRTYHIDPLRPQPGDSAAIAEYRERMGSAEGKRIYLERAATAETVNADLKTWRGLDRRCCAAPPRY